MRDLQTLHPTEEGSFPVFQAVDVVRVINEQRRKRFDVYAISQVADDGGGIPKFDAYYSQMIFMILIHGKLRDLGLLLTNCVSVDEGVEVL